MKKLLATILIIVICLSTLSGCTRPNGDLVNFSFLLEVEKNEYLRGETINVTATVTNVSGKTHRYVGCSGNDFIPNISMYKDVDGEKYYLDCDPIVLPEDVVNKKIKNGESGSVVYSFHIPEDAKLGFYDVILSYGEDKREFSDVLSIIEEPAQNDSEKYSYSAVKVSSGGVDKSINPIKTLGYLTEYSKDGEPHLHGDGWGSYGVFSDPETKMGDFPTVVADGEVVVNPPAHSSVGNPRVYDTNFEEYKYSHPGWNGLHLLPAGEYVVMFYENTDSRDIYPDAETYTITVYEDIFRLIVPERDLGVASHSLIFSDTSALADDFNVNAKYRGGERVELKLETVTEQYYKVFVNGEEAVMIGGDLSWSVFAFVMPDADATVEIDTVSVDIPSAS